MTSVVASDIFSRVLPITNDESLLDLSVIEVKGFCSKPSLVVLASSERNAQFAALLVRSLLFCYNLDKSCLV